MSKHKPPRTNNPKHFFDIAKQIDATMEKRGTKVHPSKPPQTLDELRRALKLTRELDEERQ